MTSISLEKTLCILRLVKAYNLKIAQGIIYVKVYIMFFSFNASLKFLRAREDLSEGTLRELGPLEGTQRALRHSELLSTRRALKGLEY